MAIKLKNVKKPKIQLSDFFKPEEIGPRPEDYVGKVLILDPNIVLESARKREYLIWRATGGFGCDPGAMGRAVFATCLGDGESARWDRHDFIAEYKGVLPPKPKTRAEILAEFKAHYDGYIREDLLNKFIEFMGENTPDLELRRQYKEKFGK